MTSGRLLCEPNSAKSHELAALFMRQFNYCIMFRKQPWATWRNGDRWPVNYSHRDFCPDISPDMLHRCYALWLCQCCVTVCVLGFCQNVSENVRICKKLTGGWSCWQRFLSWGRDDERGRAQPYWTQIRFCGLSVFINVGITFYELRSTLFTVSCIL